VIPEVMFYYRTPCSMSVRKFECFGAFQFKLELDLMYIKSKLLLN